MKSWSRWVMGSVLAGTIGMGTAGAPEAGAATLSAGIREHFTASGKNDYASDSASKLKLLLTGLGFPSITLQMRVAAPSTEPEALYPPKFGTKKLELETMISRIFHGNAVPVLKPMLFLRPEAGAPVALPSIPAKAGQALFSSYAQVLDPYASTLGLRSVEEFVLGQGMGEFYNARFAARWKGLIDRLRSRASGVTRISLDLDSESGIRNLESFQNADRTGFEKTFSGVRQVRFSLPIAEWIDSDSLALRSADFQALVMNRVERLSRLFPGRGLVFSNVFLPACPGFRPVGAEPDCATKAPDWQKQATLVRAFFAAWDAVPAAVSGLVREIELVAGSTQDEPLPEEADPRFLVYNPEVRDILKERLALESHGSSRISSPPRSSFRRFEPGDQKKHACIYFDESDESDRIGAIHARLIDNLVGAFPAWAKERRRMSAYQKGDLGDCDAVFYLASNYGMKVPEEFLREASAFVQKNPLAWINYKFETFYDYYMRAKFRHGFDPILFNIPRILQADAPPSPSSPDPGFFRFFHYKGEIFEKEARFDRATGVYAASPEINEIRIDDATKVRVLSMAEHSKTRQRIPYAVTQAMKDGGRMFYFADLPFSFAHYEDRSLIFSDVIYDILGEPAPDRPLLALARLEDINPSIPTEYLAKAIDYLADRSIPFSLALIPYYSNLFSNPMGRATDPIWLPADQFPEFAGFVRYAAARGASFVMHGLAHQAGDLISGFNGGTGSDYEFWTWPGDRPHPQDSPSWLMKRMELAEGVFDRMRLKVAAWESPHYAASALDYVLFGRLFEWTYHRGLYFKSEIEDSHRLAALRAPWECKTESCREERRLRAGEVKVKADYETFGGQIVPYPIFEDSYGQAVIPETIGMVDYVLYRPDTWRPVSTVADLLRRAKKLRVVRGAMASFFWHPLLLDPKGAYYGEIPGSYDSLGGIRILSALVEGLKALGYQFASIEDCRYFPRKSCR